MERRAGAVVMITERWGKTLKDADGRHYHLLWPNSDRTASLRNALPRMYDNEVALVLGSMTHVAAIDGSFIDVTLVMAPNGIGWIRDERLVQLSP